MALQIELFPRTRTQKWRISAILVPANHPQLFKFSQVGIGVAVKRQLLAATHGRRSALEAHAGMVLEAVDQTPDITIEELRAFLAARGVTASHSAVWNLLARHGLTMKNKTAHASERERSNVLAARETWRQMQQGLDPFKLVFIDESGVKTNMARQRGRAKKGKRLVASIPHGHWKSLSFIIGLRSDRTDAPWVLDRAMNGDAFRTYLRQVLGPTLAKGDTVIMDDLSTHKVAGVREAIEGTGARQAALPATCPA